MSKKLLGIVLSLSIYSVSVFQMNAQIAYKKNVPTITSDGLYKIENNGLQILIDPMVSGRVISFKLNGKELFTSRDKESFNYGATFWPSPQMDWGWPPRKEIDGKPYDPSISADQVILKGKKDSISKYQITKAFRANFSDTSIEAEYTIVNMSSSEKRVAGWEINRVATGGLSFFPAGANKPSSLSTLQINNSDNIIWYKSNSDKLEETDKKLFMHGREGWIAHIEGDIMFVKTFEDILPSQVAPKEEEIEIYANTRKGYIELENQGPYTSLKPGKSLTYKVKWYLRKLPKGINVAIGNKELVNFARKVIGSSN